MVGYNKSYFLIFFGMAWFSSGELIVLFIILGIIAVAILQYGSVTIARIVRDFRKRSKENDKKVKTLLFKRK